MSLEPSDVSIGNEIRHLCRQIDERGREFWWVKPDIAAVFESAGYHLLPRHFYSPIADPKTVAGTEFNKETYSLNKLVFDEAEALRFLSSVPQYAGELAKQFPEVKPTEADFYWENPFFTGLDAAVLYSAIRTLRPRRILEIGSGFSTHVSLRAMECNGRVKLSCVEPYPTAKLSEVSDRIEIIQNGIQQADTELFTSLESGDILFIDSSHVSCLGSDVNYAIFNILPRLSKGVIVHFHDIFLPYEYPREWVVDRRWHWNEQYLLYAFLLMNDSYQVWMPNNFLIRCHPSKVATAVPFLSEQMISGVSFWLRKIR